MRDRLPETLVKIVDRKLGHEFNPPNGESWLDVPKDKPRNDDRRHRRNDPPAHSLQEAAGVGLFLNRLNFIHGSNRYFSKG